MGASKTQQFTEKQNRLADFAKALGHPARIAILEHLIESGPAACGDIVKVLPLAQATVSQHLNELKNAKLIKDQKKGNSISYSINQKAFAKPEKRMTGLLKKVRKHKGK